MKRLLIILTVFVSCSSDKQTQRANKAVCFTIVHPPNGKNAWALSYRETFIVETSGGKAVWDTAWAYPVNLPLRDSTGKELRDSAGKVILNPKTTYVEIGKDSVMWEGIEGVSIDSLLRTFKPRSK